MTEFPEAHAPGPDGLVPMSGSAFITNGVASERDPIPNGAGHASQNDLESVALRLQQGDLLFQAGSYSAALEAFRSILDEQLTLREQIAVARRIGHCYERDGKSTDAIGVLEPLLSAIDPALLSTLDRVEVAGAYCVLGKSYLDAGKLAASEAQAHQVLALLDSRDRSHLSDIAVANNLLGAVAFRRGDVETARGHFRSARERFSAIGEPRGLAFSNVNLAAIFRVRGEWEQALDHYRAALSLHSTEGEFQKLGLIFLNTGQVLMKLGRHGEALEQIERSLKRATELPDRPRLVRTRLTLSQWHREAGELDAAQDELELCHGLLSGLALARESCLLALEEAYLARDRGELATAACALDSARSLAQELAPRGDLVIEVKVLEAELAMADGRWAEAGGSLADALELAREDRNRYREGEVQRARLRYLAGTGSVGEAEALFRTLAERFQANGEQPSLARLFEAWGAVESSVRGDAAAALTANARARDLWRRMSLRRREASAEIRMAENLLQLSRHVEAASLIQSLRERLVGPHQLSSIQQGAVGTSGASELETSAEPLRCEDLQRELERVSEHLRREQTSSHASAPDAELALRRLEEVRVLDLTPMERVRECLQVVRHALEADGGFIGRVEPASIELLSTHSMARLGGRRELSLFELSGVDLSRPTICGGLRDVDGVSLEGMPHSALLLPVQLHGRECVLYLERRGRTAPAFSRSDLNYAWVLSAEASRALPSTELTSTAIARPELERLRHGIYVADVITQDDRMLDILSLIAKVGDSPLSVLLQGETGTGKKLLAQAIHRISERRNRPFITIDCASLPESILESELFGHRKGAFTGAMNDRIGLLEEADGGTIFLDEIEKAPLTVQRRFLHLLDSGEIRPVGATSYRTLDVRVVCATSCADLQIEVEQGRFLKDLYYRLNDIALVVPALRDRPEDIALLAGCFIEKFAQLMRRDIRGCTPAFIERLRQHNWPGNVRELEKAIQRAVTLAEPGTHLVPALLPSQVLEAATLPATRERGLKGLVETFEAQAILHALERNRWNKSRTAAELRLSRKGLKAKIERYNLDRRRRRG